MNPATKILLWLALAIGIQHLGPLPLAAATAPTLAGVLLARVPGAWVMLRRARWLLLSLLLIYAFATPGDAMIPALGALSPSSHGLREGMTQAWRLALLLATLALLLHSCPREALLSGIYLLLRPLGALGMDAERVAVRLWLTLHFAQGRHTPSGAGFRVWWNELRAAAEPAAGDASQVTLERHPFTWRDVVSLTAGALLLGVALW